MKTSLLLFTLMLGISCYAQDSPVHVIYPIGRAIVRLEKKIDSLETRIIELENNCVGIKVDSLPTYYSTFGDSIVWEYDKHYRVMPYKEVLRNRKKTKASLR